MGPYIVDFLYFDPMLVIEIDGSQHTGLIAYDAKRSSFLERRGFKVNPFLEPRGARTNRSGARSHSPTP